MYVYVFVQMKKKVKCVVGAASQIPLMQCIQPIQAAATKREKLRWLFE